ncbi:hypothetical protein [Microvirga arsenatis]|uniref:Uncharacterized protein n=1 Tax=Microvirga arsenatis TaxID=2692265 RepID=A0ABW9YYB6_9HYPH|nr:hypothetical protein [Microvirga arsenatis]NBJ13202.1 hypothetical protein [Microvirga arsenatis]NBJ25160.1 hypothetical protein [Microvirga arsenatis]
MRIVVCLIGLMLTTSALSQTVDPKKIEPTCKKNWPAELQQWCIDWLKNAAETKDWKIIDAEDVAVSPRKYDGQKVKLLGLQCYYADVDDFRCVTSTPAVIFAQKVEPVPARLWLQDNCHQIRTALSSDKCRMSVRFVLDVEDIKEDIVSGYKKRVILQPPMIEAIPTRPKG